MEFLVYRSRALVAPGSAEADGIVGSSVRKNAQAGLTGFLHHEPELFLQYLEGPAETLWLLWRGLLTDPRHGEPTLIGRGPVERRLFPDCRMGCSNGCVARFCDFLAEAAGKSSLAEATAREAVWFLRGACQRLDLGLQSGAGDVA